MRKFISNSIIFCFFLLSGLGHSNTLFSENAVNISEKEQQLVAHIELGLGHCKALVSANPVNSSENVVINSENEVINSENVVNISENVVINSEKEQRLIAHVEQCIHAADNHQSKLGNRVLKLEGLSSPKVRHLLNNLCTLENTTYLEIGCWKGSTLVSALYKNQKTIESAFAIDNWSEHGGPRQTFFGNISLVKNIPLQVIESDCFTIDHSKFFHSPVTIFFYDGRHDVASQKAAFTYFDAVFDDVFIAMIDDWNEEDVRKGTFLGFQELGYKILFEKELYSLGNGDVSSWWNGIYIAVIKK